MDPGGCWCTGLGNHSMTCGRCGPAGRLPPPWPCPNGSLFEFELAMSRRAREIEKQERRGERAESWILSCEIFR